jgi:hypothetical protein
MYEFNDIPFLIDEIEHETYLDRVALWHEAGHAVVANHYGAKVKRIGLDPIPHCIVRQRGLNKHQRGVMLCAGAMMTNIMYGYEWGSHTDYAMAQQYGDLSLFQAQAEKLCWLYRNDAGYIVDMLSDGPASREIVSFEPRLDRPDDAFTDMVDRADLPEWQKGLVSRWAVLQMTYPKIFAAIGKIAY